MKYAPTVVIKVLPGAGGEFILSHIFSSYFLPVKEGNCIARKKYQSTSLLKKNVAAQKLRTSGFVKILMPLPYAEKRKLF